MGCFNAMVALLLFLVGMFGIALAIEVHIEYRRRKWSKVWEKRWAKLVAGDSRGGWPTDEEIRRYKKEHDD